MAPTGFVISEEKSPNTLTLIVDKIGIFGEDVAAKFHESITTVLVTAKKASSHNNIIIVPYTKTIPDIPEGNYSHMFFVWDGKNENFHVLEPLLQKAAEDKAQFVFVTDYHFYSEKLVGFINQQYSKASIVFTGDIFGNSQYESSVTTLFQEALKGNIRLESVGLKYVYPVFFEDVVAEVVKIGLGNKKGKIFLACQNHAMTELSLSHLLQKVDPLVKIDFKKDEVPSFNMPDGEFLFDTDYDAIKKIQDVYTDMFVKQKGQLVQGKGPFFFSPFLLQKEKTVNKKRKKQWVGFVLLLLIFLFSPLMLVLFYAGLGGVVLYAAADAVSHGDYQKAVSFSTTSKNLFVISSSANIFAQKELNLMFLGRVSVFLTNTLEEGNLLATLLADGGEAAGKFSNLTKGKSLSPQADFLSAINALKNALFVLEKPSLKGSISGISLSSFSENIQPFSSTLDIAPTLFGLYNEKKYMILFQNNMELRPGGGFIGSYALVTLNKGKITSFSIHDVYDADGQLKGHVEPPYIIRRYIPQQHWYLRDSNFDVDFSQDAANAAFFLREETGQKVDGVIGIDLTFVKDILSAIGPVYVPEYKENVTAGNLFLLTETHAEKNSFAGSTQKKDFLKAIFLAMQQKIQIIHGFSPKAIIPLLLSVKSKDVVFGFSDPLVQDVFTVNGLSGALWDSRKQEASIINDVTGINEANIGVNKANYFVTRSVSQDMTIDDNGSISGKLTLLYKNKSKKNTWPGGPYKNYLRVILPGGAKLSEIIIDGKKQQLISAITDFKIYEASGFVMPNGLEVDSSIEDGKQIYGFIITVPEGTTQRVEVAYTLSQKANVKDPTLEYSGWLIKQPGVDAYPYKFTLNVPENFSLLQKPGWVKGSGNSVYFSKSFGEDMPFVVSFTLK